MRLIAASLAGLVVLALAGWGLYVSTGASGSRARAPGGASVEGFCASCHKLPPPDTLPRSEWKAKVEAMFEIVGHTKDDPPQNAPPVDEAVAYFTSRAPERLPPSRSTVGVGPGPLDARRVPLKLSGVPRYPGTAHVHFVHLFDDARFDMLLCEMRFGMVLAMRPYEDLAKIQLLARVPHPCHAEVVDLDRDGLRDILVANLGTVTPSDVTNGSVVWVRGTRAGTFESRILAADLGRVADAQAADFDSDGDIDVIVAVFGWRKVGEVLLLENRTTDFSSPVFEPFVVDSRPGAINVPVADLDGDGLPDFMALISQHFETVVAYHNRGGGRFELHTVFEADHPNWGSSHLELADLDGDADLDVLMANGDTLDDLVLKPYHGLSWLENRGTYPFEHHRLTDILGAHGASAADLDGDGDLDVAASTFLPFVKPDTPGADLAESILWLEQASPGAFRRWSLEAVTCTHPTLDAADYDADGDADFAVGNMTMAKGEKDSLEDWVLLFQNLRSEKRR
ncbi:MAG: VCBS repeat-containing protein [Planctomycetes bacterium]|nr:VCBS repeat-containing protein [Planctomycetota bacterium]